MELFTTNVVEVDLVYESHWFDEWTIEQSFARYGLLELDQIDPEHLDLVVQE